MDGINYGEHLWFQAEGKTIEVFPQDEGKEEVAMNVAQYPVENGAPMANHVQEDHKQLDFSGLVVGDNLTEADAKYIQLMYWAQAGTLVDIHGVWTVYNCLISNVTKTRKDGQQNALGFSISLIEVRLPKSSWTKRQNLGVQPAAQGPGTYVTVQPGNTYWGWWCQYGTAIQTLRDWNHWPDRIIPIGARARVK
ncbi:phage baseplate protein [Furfurilactobacillus sp. WILCCON 0119]